MSSKKKKKAKCPYPRCLGEFEHDGDHSFKKNKGGRKPGGKWNPQLRKFVEYLKEGKQQTEAARLAYPKYSKPDIKACKLMKNVLVVAEMAEYHRLKAITEQKAAEAEGKELGRRRAVTKADVMDRLWTLANTNFILTNGTITGQVRASVALSEILGMKIGAQNPDKFEGFTDSELEQYAKDGTVPERFASRFGITPGSSSQIM